MTSSSQLLRGIILGASVVVGVAAAWTWNRKPDPEFILQQYRKGSGVGSRRPDNEEEELIDAEQYVRNTAFFGEERQRQIRDSFVVVVGLGGVGSHLAVSLARSGVGRLRLIDFDRVTVSSLNRHATALRRDVGRPKVECVKKLILAACPNCRIDIIDGLFDEAKAHHFLEGGGRPDIVADCIDNIPTKTTLVEYCATHHIPCISSGGAGGKRDPTKLRIASIEDTWEDDLARAVRIRLRKRGVGCSTPMVFSTEKADKGLLPLRDFQEDNPDDYRPLENFRVRVMPVIGPIPALMGQAMAAFILSSLAGLQVDVADKKSVEAEEAVDRITRRNFKDLCAQVRHFVNRQGKDDIDTSGLVVEFSTARKIYAVFCGRSAVSPGKILPPGALQLVPWIVARREMMTKVMKPGNLVTMTTKEAQKHLEMCSELGREEQKKNLVEMWGQGTVDRIESVLRTM